MADVDSSQPVVTFKKRNNKTNARKRVITPQPASDSDSGFETSEDEQGRQIKRRKKNAGVAVSSSNDNKRRAEVPIVADVQAVLVSNAENATKASNWYDEESNPGVTKKPVTKPLDQTPNDGTYKGTANYQSFIQKNPDRQFQQLGPQKTSSNIRTIIVTDFAPDVCKDYKQTGFCGFGDSCKFLHAREDYAQGWQLDRQWEINTKGKKLTGRTVASADRNSKQGEAGEDDESMLEKIPFACIICKKSYTNPIVTKCGHYFCEACALKRYKKDPSCAACESGTGGVFNGAKKLNRLLERKRERQKQKREQAIADGEEPPPTEEGE